MQPHLKTQNYLQENLPRYLDLLRQMVAINSFTDNPAGVNELSTMTAKAFTTLGFQAEHVQSTNPEYGRHLILTRKGFSDHKIGLVSHLDTVFPSEEETQNNFQWRESGDRIYGPGTVDIKGGTVLIYMVLDAIKTFAPEIFDATTWVVLVNASEETMSIDFGEICKQRLNGNTLACLIFEGGKYMDDEFVLVTARKGRGIFNITVEGKASHAGTAHKQGANAIVQIADTIQQIASLTDYKRRLTVNVGTVSGGTVVNRVPHLAKAEVEMRTFSPKVFDETVAKIRALEETLSVSSANGFPCKVNIEIIDRTAPWARNDATDNLLTTWRKAANELEMRVTRETRGGLSDGNLLWNHVPTLDGLGPSGGNAHCSERSPDGSKDQEYVEVSSIVPKAMLNLVAILKLLEQS